MKRSLLVLPFLVVACARARPAPGPLAPETQEASLPPANATLRVPQDYATIQAAVAAAGAGDRIVVGGGTYHGTVNIVGTVKNGLQIVGDGARLVGNHSEGMGTRVCYFARDQLCPEGRAGFYLRDVSGVVIRGFTVTDFGLGASSCEGEGVLLVNAHYNRIEHMSMTASDMMGVTLLNSTHNVIAHNRLFLNDVERPGRCGTGCGVHVQGGPRTGPLPVPGPASADNVIQENEIWGNPFAGVMLRSAGAGNAVINNVIFEGSRWGITNWATNGTRIEGNEVRDHRGFQASWDSTKVIGVGDGIDVRTSSDVIVRGNTARGNSGHDVFWDSTGTGNRFLTNRCTTASPSGICP